jgi:prepilin-type N-terminal cleavage/methylation domain-containing protein
MKKKGFTLVELLVVIGIIALLMGVFILVLARLRQRAFRMTCQTNLSQIGKAMLIYTPDYTDPLPRAGGESSTWRPKINNWQATYRWDAFGINRTDGSGGHASVSSSLYLLVKYTELNPKLFVCPGDPGATEFKLPPGITGLSGQRPLDLIDVWDFGPNPSKHCSYSYHMLYGPYALTFALSQRGMAIAADRNPWIDTPAAKAKDFSLFKWDGNTRQQKAGNAFTHKGEGQNVLFMDAHVAFEKFPFCGVKDDNIYTYWDGEDIQRGAVPVLGSQPADKLDSLLVHDPPVADQQ